MSYYNQKYLKYKTKYLEEKYYKNNFLDLKGGKTIRGNDIISDTDRLESNANFIIIDNVYRKLESLKIYGIRDTEKKSTLSILIDSLYYPFKYKDTDTYEEKEKQLLENAYCNIFNTGKIDIDNATTHILNALTSIANLKNQKLIDVLIKILPHFFKAGKYKHKTNGKDDASSNNSSKPWVVVVMGLNGIRKTSLMNMNKGNTIATLLNKHLPTISIEDMPTGENSFFRQLDFMIPSISSKFFEEFKKFKGKLDLFFYKIAKHILFTSMIGTLAKVWLQVVSIILGGLKYNMLIEATGQNFDQVDSIDKLSVFTDYNKLIIRCDVPTDKVSLDLVGQSISVRFENEFEELKKSDPNLAYTTIIGGSTTEKEESIEFSDGSTQETISYISVNEKSRNTWEEKKNMEKYTHWKKAEIIIFPYKNKDWDFSIVSKEIL